MASVMPLMISPELGNSIHFTIWRLFGQWSLIALQNRKSSKDNEICFAILDGNEQRDEQRWEQGQLLSYKNTLFFLKIAAHSFRWSA